MVAVFTLTFRSQPTGDNTQETAHIDDDNVVQIGSSLYVMYDHGDHLVYLPVEFSDDSQDEDTDDDLDLMEPYYVPMKSQVALSEEEIQCVWTATVNEKGETRIEIF
jgi:hypothetical protein